MKPKHIYRNSKDGKIVSKKYALANPDTTQRETVFNLRKELILFYEATCNITVSKEYVENIVDEYLSK